MKILLIQALKNLHEPSGHMRTCYLEPIGLEYIASSLEAAGHVVRIEYGAITLGYFVQSIYAFSPDMIGYSVYTYTYDISLEFSKAAKKMTPQIVNVFGGYHPTVLPEIALEPSIDYVVIGEGENTFLELVTAIEKGSPVAGIKGIAYSEGVRLTINERRPRIADLDSLPRPKRTFDMLCKTRQYQIAFPPPSKQQSVAQVSFSRGCPYNCDFCSSKSVWGLNVVWRDPIKVVDEIEHLYENYNTNLVYFPDLTFNANRAQVRAICTEFTKRDLPVYWWGLFRVDNINNEMLHQLKEAKCVKLSFGIESTKKSTIETIKGKPKYDWERASATIKEASNLGMIVKAFLMIGLPDDTRSDLESLGRQIEESDIDEVRVSFCTPFPGTLFYQRCLNNNLILTRDFSKFTTELPLLKNAEMNVDEMVFLRNEIVANFYCSKRYQQNKLTKINKFPFLAASWIEYLEFLRSKNIFTFQQAINIDSFIQTIGNEASKREVNYESRVYV